MNTHTQTHTYYTCGSLSMGKTYTVATDSSDKHNYGMRQFSKQSTIKICSSHKKKDIKLKRSACCVAWQKQCFHEHELYDPDGKYLKASGNL